MKRREPSQQYYGGSAASNGNSFKSKKSRLEGSTDELPESCVLHLRGLPVDVTDHDIAELAIPFGSISNMILTKKNGQALIEMDTLQSTVAMHDYYISIGGPVIRGKGSIELQYSKYTSLTKPNSNQQTVVAIEDANKQFSNARDDDTLSRTVLHIQLEQVTRHLDLGYLPFFKAFHRFGHILRVISFKKSDSRHAFVEFDNPTSAYVAKLQMHGTPLFGNDGHMCVLRVEFSRQVYLEVHREDGYSRDFTRNPWDEMNESIDDRMMMGKYANYGPMKDDLDGLSEERLANLDPFCLSALANRIIKPLLNIASNIGGPQADMLRAQANTLGGLSSFVSDHFDPRSYNDGYDWPTLGPIPAHDDFRDIPPNFNTPVVFVSNLNTEHVNPDTLFILFGVYGDVQRVKIIHNKRSTALVQLSDPAQALRVVDYLNGVPLYGQRVRCVISKNSSVTMPQGSTETESENRNTCDYSNHRLHRFKRANSRNLQNICAPSTVLHISNVPEDADEDYIRSTFENVTKAVVRKMKIFRADKRMALIQFGDLDEAVAALISMHDYPLGENNIRVSFSKSII